MPQVRAEEVVVSYLCCVCSHNAILNKWLFCQDIRSFFGGASKATTKAPEASKGDMHILHIAAQANASKAQ